MVHVTKKLCVCFFCATQVKPNIPLGTSSGTTASTRRWPGTALPQPPKVGSKTKARPGWRWWDFTELAGRGDYFDAIFFGGMMFFLLEVFVIPYVNQGFLLTEKRPVVYPLTMCTIRMLHRYLAEAGIFLEAWYSRWHPRVYVIRCFCMIFVFVIKSFSMYPEYPSILHFMADYPNSFSSSPLILALHGTFHSSPCL